MGKHGGGVVQSLRDRGEPRPTTSCSEVPRVAKSQSPRPRVHRDDHDLVRAQMHSQRRRAFCSIG